MTFIRPTVFLFLALAASAPASLIAVDDFSGATPTLGFAASWSTFSGSGIGYSNSNPLLSGGGRYATTTPGATSYVDFDGLAASRLATALSSTEGLWFGYAGRWTGAGGNGRDAGISLYGSSGQFFAGVPINVGDLGVDLFGAGISTSTVTPVSGRTYRIEANLRADGGYALYIDGSLALTGTRSGGIAPLTRIYLGADAAGLTVEADEIRFGTTRADVQAVPEPASLAALGLGTLAFLRRRRRACRPRG